MQALTQTGLRRFSGQIKLIQSLPYKIGNNYNNLVTTRPSTNLSQLQAVSKFVNSSEKDIALGFSVAYKSLLKAIVERDEEMIDQMCEGDLADKFIASFDKWQRNSHGLELVLQNFAEADLLTHRLKFDVIDFGQFAGVSISRKKNRQDGIQMMNPFFMDMKNFEFYMPKNPLALAGKFLNAPKGPNGKPVRKMEGITIEVLVRFCTRTKVAVRGYDPDTESSYYLGQNRDEEYHFVKFEGSLPPVEINIEKMKEIAKNMVIEDWTITDFDNCLKGNPHV